MAHLLGDVQSALVTKNTFLEARPEPEDEVSRVRSDPTPSCSSVSSSSDADVSRVLRPARGADVEHKVWGKLDISDSSETLRPARGAGVEHKVWGKCDISVSSDRSKVDMNGIIVFPSDSSVSLEHDAPQEGKGTASSAHTDLDQRTLHELGQCKPCRYFMSTKSGCVQGSSCHFCHLPHEARVRPCKAQRVKAKARARELLALATADRDSKQDPGLQQKLHCGGAYFQSVVRASLKEPEPAARGSATSSSACEERPQRHIVSL